MHNPGAMPQAEQPAKEATWQSGDEERSGLRARPSAARAPGATDAARWHAARHHAIVSEHPEVRSLFGVDRWTAAWVAALVVAQYGVAFALRRQPFVLILLAVLLVGAPIAHALGVLIHECAHNLVFRVAWKNKALAVFANLGIIGPGAIAFRHQHLMHHKLLGDTREPEGGDTQAPTRNEIQWAGSSPLRRLCAYTLGHFLWEGRPGDKPPRDSWLLVNVASCVVAGTALAATCGLRSLSYVMFSLLFAFGPHPLGARRLSEHLTVKDGQPTVSYYGLANWMAFQVGHHVEHHDFPRVPWSRVRRLRRIAREHYDGLASVSSWTTLLRRHLFDPSLDRGRYVGFSLEDGRGQEDSQPSAGL